ncbi:MAG: nickel-dependent lactate racemase [Planctomycetaceae bacterium]|nr:nickel-dependent lactate racemase [Planctomycetaceae bacterium]
MKLPIPFDSGFLELDLPDRRIAGVVRSRLAELRSTQSERDVVEAALAAPIGSPPLAELAKGKRRVCVITSDHTRPVPSRITLPPLLAEIRRGSPEADISIVIATGCHRAMTEEEMRDRFGDDVFEAERFLVHDCGDDATFASIGTLPSGGDCLINRVVLDTDLLVSEGFIEPHFFAGYSGGRKAVLPGCANRVTVLANHCAEFIDSPLARTGILDGNPIHADMMYAARAANLAFILNVVLDPDKKIVAAFAGDMERAHRTGCDFFASYGEAPAVKARMVVTSNGGYPLDQNLYQAVKSMTAAEACAVEGGVIIVASACRDGHGGEDFLHAFSRIPTAEALLREFLSRGRRETVPDQWQTQILCRILTHHHVIMVTGPGAPPEMIRAMNMRWAPTLADAVREGERLLGDTEAEVTVIPDGVGVIIRA